MNILFVFFALSHLSESSMYSDLVNEFKQNGHNVFPMAPSTVESSSSYLSLENEIEVLRIHTMNVFTENIIRKGVANVLLPYQYKKAFNRFWSEKHIDVVIVATPSVMFASFVSFIKKRSGSIVYLMQKDIFPQNAVDLGFIKKNSLLYSFFRYNEINLLRVADFVGCTSLGNVEYMINHNGFLNKEQVHLLYNSTTLLTIKLDQSIRAKNGLENKFVVVFGGNMGKPQQLDNVLYLAHECEKFEDVIFLIIGKGTETDRFKEQAKAKKIQNTIFLNSMKRNEYFSILSTCNVGLISLHKDFTVPNTPMKLNDYLNAGIPVLASIDRNNDLGNMLTDNKMGIYAYADTPDDLFEQFKKIYYNKNAYIEFGNNGLKFSKKNMSTENSYQIIMRYISSKPSK